MTAANRDAARAAGTRPTGYNTYWFRPGVNTLRSCRSSGFTYHIDALGHQDTAAYVTAFLDGGLP
jgi:hypothetical protein